MPEAGPVLIVAPHPMDEVLGCGGCMALLSDAGHDTHTLVLFGSGEGRHAERRQASLRASEILGTRAPDFVGLPENAGDTVPLGKVIGIVEDALRLSRATIVLASHGGNLNVDHQIAFRATVTAVRPAPGVTARRFLSYEIPSSTDWTTPSFAAAFRPTNFFDIERSLDRKIEALSQPGPDCRPWPHAWAIEAVRNLALARGASVGIGAAEAFCLERHVGPPADYFAVT